MIVIVIQAAILQQAAEYISFLIAERQHLLELNRQYIAATSRLPPSLPSAPTGAAAVKRPRKGSDGELSSEDDGGNPMALLGPGSVHHPLSYNSLSSESRYKRRSSPTGKNFDARSLPIKKRKDEVSYTQLAVAQTLNSFLVMCSKVPMPPEKSRGHIFKTS